MNATELTGREDELADEDEQAEHEDGAGDAEPGEQAGEEGEQQPQPGGAAFEKVFEAELRRHEQAMADVFGADFAELVPCTHCGSAGFVPGGQIQPHPDRRACPECQGFGVMTTGSRDERYATDACPRCGGRGYLERNPGPVVPHPAPAAAATEPAEWGTPSWMGDPAIGRS